MLEANISNMIQLAGCICVVQCISSLFLHSFSYYYFMVIVVAKCYICDRLLNQQVKTP